MSHVLPLTVDDVPGAAELVQRFAEESHHPAAGNLEATARFLADHVGTERAIAYKLEDDRGMLTGIIFGIFGSDWLSGEKLAQELVWYTLSRERRGLELMRAFTEEAKRRGAKWVLSGFVPHFHGDRMERVLGGLGFKEIEKWWMKEID